MKIKNIAYLILIFVFIMLSVLLPIIIIKLTFKTDYLVEINTNLNEIEKNSNELNENLILSIIKAESNFNKNAVSSSDAFGLMQLQFSTAKEVANKLNIEISINDLYNPNINIKLGVNYLNNLFSIFSEKELVIISYNAGPNRVKEWINNNELKKENNLYVTPFIETTNYLKKVLQNEKIYKKIRG